MTAKQGEKSCYSLDNLLGYDHVLSLALLAKDHQYLVHKSIPCSIVGLDYSKTSQDSLKKRVLLQT